MAIRWRRFLFVLALLVCAGSILQMETGIHELVLWLMPFCLLASRLIAGRYAGEALLRRLVERSRFRARRVACAVRRRVVSVAGFAQRLEGAQGMHRGPPAVAQSA